MNAGWELPALTRNDRVDRVIRMDPNRCDQQIREGDIIWQRDDEPKSKSLRERLRTRNRANISRNVGYWTAWDTRILFRVIRVLIDLKPPVYFIILYMDQKLKSLFLIIIEANKGVCHGTVWYHDLVNRRSILRFGGAKVWTGLWEISWIYSISLAKPFDTGKKWDSSQV